MERMAQQDAHPGHLPVVLGEGRALMGVKKIEVHVISCDGCNYTVEQDESEVTVFDTAEQAVAYVKDNDWLAEYAPEGDVTVRCPECKRGES